MKNFSLFCVLYFVSLTLSAQTKADMMLDFMLKNKTNFSIFLQKNDTALAAYNENKLMPLASTVKILVAVEFAKQAAAHVIEAGEAVSLADLNKYYIPNTDGGAHPAWLQYEEQQKHIFNDSINLIDVARGMMIFSSNANTEYLMDLLGLDNINNDIPMLGLKKHTTIFPIVASLFLYQNPRNIAEKKLIKGITSLNEEEYCRFTYDIHKALKYNDSLKAKFRPQDLTMPMQRVWSERLPASTTSDYVHVAKIINNRKFLSKEAYEILATVQETLMENPGNKKMFIHAGMKGGSTAWVLTKTLYATLLNGDRIEMAYFFNNLQPQEQENLQSWMNSFELDVLTNEDFRAKLTKAFPHVSK
jgi:D-alanyl-D-alanine carboxypeptidase